MIKPTPEQLDKFLEYETLYNKLCERRTNYSPIMFGPEQYNGEELYIRENCKCTKHPSDYFESEGIQYYMEYNLGDEREVLR